jgi:hypothetical protein
MNRATERHARATERHARATERHARATLVAIAAALSLVGALSLDAQAAGGRFSGSRGGGGASVAPHGGAIVAPRGFHGSPHTAVVVRGGFFFGWPGPYPYYWPPYYYGPAYYAAPVYYSAPAMAEPEPPAAYWYYCPPLGAYYPYVHDCPEAWQPVAPTPY